MTSPRLGVIFDTISVKARWERWCRWNCDLRVINAFKKRLFLLYWRCRHDTQITWPYAYRITLGSHCKMANSSSEDETDTLPERPTRIQPYQFEPVGQDFERVPEHHVSFEAKPIWYSSSCIVIPGVICDCYSSQQNSRLAELTFLSTTRIHSLLKNLRWQPHWLPRLTSLPGKPTENKID